MTGLRLSLMGVFALGGDLTGQATMSLVFTQFGPRVMMQAIAVVLTAAAVLFVAIRCQVTIFSSRQGKGREP